MMSKLYYIVLTILAALLAPALTSCGDRGEPDASGETYMVSFLLDPGVTSPARGAKDGPAPDDITGEEEGEAFENHIIPSTISVALYDMDNNRVAAALPLAVTEASDSPQRLTRYLGSLVTDRPLEELKDMRLKLMIFANCDTGTLGPAEVSFAACGSRSDFEAIPMWGQRVVSLAGIKKGAALDLGTVDMLRAMAKFEVRLAEGLADASLAAMEATNIASAGWVAPSGWDSDRPTAAINNGNPLRVNLGMPVVTPKVKARGDILEMYVPESSAPVDLRVGYTSGGAEYVGVIELRPYVNGKPDAARRWDVTRNRIFRYTITSVQKPGLPDAEFDWELRINNWLEGDDFKIEED